MRQNHQAPPLAFLVLALVGCTSASIPFSSHAIESPVAGATPQATPSVTPPEPIKDGGRYENLDRAMEIQIGTEVIGSFDTVLRFDSPLLGRGVPIDFEKDLGFTDKSTVLRLDLKYKLGMRHRLEFSYFDITRRANWKLDKEIQIGDQIFPINIDVTATLDTTIYKGAYRYLFAMGDSWDLSASAGLHTFGLGVGISEDGTTNKTAKENLTLPLPVIGLGGNLALSRKLRLSTTWELFGIKIDNFKGYLVDARISLDWDIWEKIGAGIGWNGFLMDIELKDNYLGGDLLTGNFVYKYQGLLVYFRIFF